MTIGNLMKIGGPHTSQIIEGSIIQIFDKFVNNNEQSNKPNLYSF